MAKLDLAQGSVLLAVTSPAIIHYVTLGRSMPSWGHSAHTCEVETLDSSILSSEPEVTCIGVWEGVLCGEAIKNSGLAQSRSPSASLVSTKVFWEIKDHKLPAGLTASQSSS